MKTKYRNIVKVTFIIAIVLFCFMIYNFFCEVTVINKLLYGELQSRSIIFKDNVTVPLFIDVQFSPIYSWLNSGFNSYIIQSLQTQRPFENLKIIARKDAVPIREFMGHIHTDGAAGYKDAESGEMGESISIGPIYWVHPFKVKVRCSSYVNPLWGGSSELIMALGFDGWKQLGVDNNAIY
ncbi:MAG: hypothetical protein JXA06_09010 [Bacteroidetes bacterium]|nr:hypothetical protein [Bacteroidota bacterium]